jgi:hypothetical protein
MLREEHRLRVLRRIFGSKKEAVQNCRELQNDEPHDYIHTYMLINTCARTHTHTHTHIYIYIYTYRKRIHSINPNICKYESKMWNVKEVVEACSTCNRRKMCVQCFGGDTLRKEPERRWDKNIKLDLQETGWECVD